MRWRALEHTCMPHGCMPGAGADQTQAVSEGGGQGSAGGCLVQFLLACPSPLPLGNAVFSTPVSCMQLSALLFLNLFIQLCFARPLPHCSPRRASFLALTVCFAYSAARCPARHLAAHHQRGSVWVSVGQSGSVSVGQSGAVWVKVSQSGSVCADAHARQVIPIIPNPKTLYLGSSGTPKFVTSLPPP